MSLSSTYKTNQSKEVAGVRVVKGMTEDNREIAFTIGRSGKANKRYTKAMERLAKPHARAIQLETLSPEMAEAINMQGFIEGCLLGWENVPMSDVTGNPESEGDAAFSRQYAQMLFENLPDLYADLTNDASKAALFRDDALEAIAGN